MTNNCIECENEIMLKYSDLATEYDIAQERITLLEKNLKATRKLCDFYSKRCEELENRVRIYQESIERKNND